MAKKTGRKAAPKGRGGARKGAGRTATLEDAKFLGIKIPGALLARVDKWGAAQSPALAQSAAVRLLLDKALTADGA